jgi:ubiquinone/menaquinone biosynthesis C-methylase UbiE
MSKNKNRVCPVEIAGSLDTKFRRWLQNPYKLLKHYINEGMTVLDVGCGPGFFSIAMAEMVGLSGKVVAADLQEGMLDIIRNKIMDTDLEKIIQFHKCEKNEVGYKDKVDFILAFYMIHELPDHKNFFNEIYKILKPQGQLLIVEPKLFHVSYEEFKLTIGFAGDAGFQLIDTPKILFSRSAILKKV